MIEVKEREILSTTAALKAPAAGPVLRDDAHRAVLHRCGPEGAEGRPVLWAHAHRPLRRTLPEGAKRAGTVLRHNADGSVFNLALRSEEVERRAVLRPNSDRPVRRLAAEGAEAPGAVLRHHADGPVLHRSALEGGEAAALGLLRGVQIRP